MDTIPYVPNVEKQPVWVLHIYLNTDVADSVTTNNAQLGSLGHSLAHVNNEDNVWQRLVKVRCKEMNSPHSGKACLRKYLLLRWDTKIYCTWRLACNIQHNVYRNRFNHLADSEGCLSFQGSWNPNCSQDSDLLPKRDQPEDTSPSRPRRATGTSKHIVFIHHTSALHVKFSSDWQVVLQLFLSKLQLKTGADRFSYRHATHNWRCTGTWSEVQITTSIVHTLWINA